MNHIKFDDGISWCGEILTAGFHFKDIEQVTINNLHGERLPCQFCLRGVISALLIVPPAVQLTLSEQYSKIESYGGTL